jgi:hypothetical protein
MVHLLPTPNAENSGTFAWQVAAGMALSIILGGIVLVLFARPALPVVLMSDSSEFFVPFVIFTVIVGIIPPRLLFLRLDVAVGLVLSPSLQSRSRGRVSVMISKTLGGTADPIRDLLIGESGVFIQPADTL